MPLAPPGGAQVARAERAPLAAYPRHPEPLELAALIGGLLDRQVVAIARSNPPREAPGPESYRADYVDAHGVVSVSVSVPLELAVGLAAGLALVPLGTAQTWIEAGALPDDAVGNLYEVLNVLSAPFNDVNLDRHVKIVAMLNVGEPTSDELAELYRVARKVEVLDVTVDEYPGGPLMIFSR